MNFKDRIPGNVKTILSVLARKGGEAYVVGGAVRSLIIGIPPHDYDVATSLTPDQTMEALRENDITVIDTNGIKHGTVTAVIDGAPVEITTFREDGDYTDSRHPDSVVFTRDIKGDVARRDFTMNALYLDGDGNVCDPEGGIRDIEAKVIRCVGTPERRFEEDALRIMRALRFKAQLGFMIDPGTKKAMEEKAFLLEKVSSERIREEFTGMIVAPFASETIRENIDILSFILPELKIMQGFDQRSKYHDLDLLEHTLKVLDGIPPDETGKRPEILAYAALLHDVGKPQVFTVDEQGQGHMKGHEAVSSDIALRFAGEFKFSRALKENVTELVRHHDLFVPRDRASVHRLMCSHTPEFLDMLFVLQNADIIAHAGGGADRMKKLKKIIEIRDELVKENVCLSVRDLEVNGDDLAEFGIPRGVKTGETLNALLEAVIDGKVTNRRQELLDFLKTTS